MQLFEGASQGSFVVCSRSTERGLVRAAHPPPERRRARPIRCQLCGIGLGKLRQRLAYERGALSPGGELADQPRRTALRGQCQRGGGCAVDARAVALQPGGLGASRGRRADPLRFAGGPRHRERLVQEVGCARLAAPGSDQPGHDEAEDPRQA